MPPSAKRKVAGRLISFLKGVARGACPSCSHAFFCVPIPDGCACGAAGFITRAARSNEWEVAGGMNPSCKKKKYTNRRIPAGGLLRVRGGFFRRGGIGLFFAFRRRRVGLELAKAAGSARYPRRGVEHGDGVHAAQPVDGGFVAERLFKAEARA